MDDVPELIQTALAKHANAPGYPTAAGIVELRQAWINWVKTVANCDLTVDQVVPTLGSKELVAWLPIIFGLAKGSTVAIPELAYPTYAVGALMAHANVITYVTAQDITDTVDLIWVNTPSNPTGQVLSAVQLKEIVERGRKIGAPIVSDECYIELGWSVKPVSVLDRSVNDGDLTGILAVYSLSKRSNLAGYRSGAVVGDPELIDNITSLRKHSGMLLPTPIQHATIAALGDTKHVEIQKAKYGARRDLLHTALVEAGFEISHSEAGLYLWATRGEDCFATVDWLATRGILVAPGDFYGVAGAKHIRVAMTGTDERISQFASRLRS